MIKLKLFTFVLKAIIWPMLLWYISSLILFLILLQTILVFLWKTQFHSCLRVFKLSIAPPPGFADPQIFGCLAHLSGNDSPYLRNGFSTSTQLLPTPGSRALSNPPLPLLTLIHSSYPNLNLYNIFSIFSHCFASSKNISSMRSRLLSCLLLQPQCLE